jgi:hypothetical protein
LNAGELKRNAPRKTKLLSTSSTRRQVGLI